MENRRIIPCIRIFKGSLYDFSCVGLLVGTWRKRLDFRHFQAHKTGVQLFGSSDRLYSRFLFIFVIIRLFRFRYTFYHVNDYGIKLCGVL